MDHRSREEFFAIVAPGLEPACAEELLELGLGPVEIFPGGVEFAGFLADLYRANLELRTASRIVVRFGRFRCRDFPALYRQVSRLPWGRFVRAGTALQCRVTCRNSRLIHSGRVEETVRAAADHALGRPPLSAAGGQLVLVRIVDDVVELSLDSSGELLHRRGYRTSVAAAPLRETLAAGLLRLLGWDGGEPLTDPMCGTGTLLSEGALLAARRAPGLQREFGFSRWPGYRPGLWEQLCRNVRRGERPCPVAIAGADCDAAALAAAAANLERAGVAAAVTLQLRSLTQQPVHAGSGLVVCNPPYGKRLATSQPPVAYYAALGHELQRAYPGWRKALLCPEPGLVEAAGLPFQELATLDNGGLRVSLYATPRP